MPSVGIRWVFGLIPNTVCKCSSAMDLNKMAEKAKASREPLTQEVFNPSVPFKNTRKLDCQVGSPLNNPSVMLKPLLFESLICVADAYSRKKKTHLSSSLKNTIQFLQVDSDGVGAQALMLSTPWMELLATPCTDWRGLDGFGTRSYFMFFLGGRLTTCGRILFRKSVMSMFLLRDQQDLSSCTWGGKLTWQLGRMHIQVPRE